MTTEEIIKWKKFNKEYLALESCFEKLRDAFPDQKAPQELIGNLFHEFHGFNTAQFANFLGQLVENFRDMCVEYECSKIKNL